MMTLLIPEWLVYGAMFYLSAVSILCSRNHLFLDTVHLLAFLPQAFLYILFDLLPVPVEVRAVFVRVSLFLIPLYLGFVLTSQYWRYKLWTK